MMALVQITNIYENRLGWSMTASAINVTIWNMDPVAWISSAMLSQMQGVDCFALLFWVSRVSCFASWKWGPCPYNAARARVWVISTDWAPVFLEPCFEKVTCCPVYDLSQPELCDSAYLGLGWVSKESGVFARLWHCISWVFWLRNQRSPGYRATSSVCIWMVPVPLGGLACLMRLPG